MTLAEFTMGRVQTDGDHGPAAHGLVAHISNCRATGQLGVITLDPNANLTLDEFDPVTATAMI